MTKVMIASVYDAFRAANVSDAQAREAAQDLAAYDDRLGNVEHKIDTLDAKIDARTTLLQWMIGANTLLLVAVLARLFIQ